MALGRPHSKDFPEKYRESFDLYQLTQPRNPPGSTLADQVATYLEWAITSQNKAALRMRPADLVKRFK